jgi:thiol-disulfide isomerase/thioredoxin
MLRTPLYEDKLIFYMDNVVPQIPDTLIKEVDYIIEKCRSDSMLFKFCLITLFNKYGKSNIMGMDAVQVHIADKYYITDAWWSDEKFINELKERVAILKPLVLGKIAPDFQFLNVPTDHFKAAENDTALKRYPHAGILTSLSKISADFIVLLFWEANCSHCKKSVPEMYKIYKENLEAMGVKVISVSVLFGEDGKEKWVNFVNDHTLYDWINAWNPYDYQFKITYDVRTTPQIFILNKKKEIIGKRIGPEDVTGLIEAYKKQFP